MNPWYPSNSGSLVPWFIVIRTHKKKKGVEESQTWNQASIGNHKRNKKKIKKKKTDRYTVNGIRQKCRHCSTCARNQKNA